MIACSDVLKEHDTVFAYDGLGTIKCVVVDHDADNSPIVVFRNPASKSGYASDTICTYGDWWSMSGEWDALPENHPWVREYQKS